MLQRLADLELQTEHWKKHSLSPFHPFVQSSLVFLFILFSVYEFIFFSFGTSVSAAALCGSAREHADLTGSQGDPPPASSAHCQLPLSVRAEE